MKKISITYCISAATGKRSLQPLPLSSQDRWIIDAYDSHVPYVCVNWPGEADTVLPEGLQYQSISNVVGKISETGFNAIRLTFAIEMVDDILENGGDVWLTTANKNPNDLFLQFILQVFDAVAAELATKSIYLNLDNHVSKAMWCCALNDGNSWFGDTYFDTTKWIRGLSYMAVHGRDNWPTFSSIGLHNELRLTTTLTSTLQPYTWSTWKTYMTAAATAVDTVNPNLLIFFSGIDSDFNIEPAVGGSTLADPSFSFTIATYPFGSSSSLND